MSLEENINTSAKLSSSTLSLRNHHDETHTVTDIWFIDHCYDIDMLCFPIPKQHCFNKPNHHSTMSAELSTLLCRLHSFLPFLKPPIIQQMTDLDAPAPAPPSPSPQWLSAKSQDGSVTCQKIGFLMQPPLLSAFR